MSKVIADMSMSLDGYIAGPNDSIDNPLGDDGERLHEWMTSLESWQQSHGLEGGERNQDSEIAEEYGRDVGAYILGRRMFDNGQGPWGDDPFRGHWGDNPPYHQPVFVLTHHPRLSLPMEGGTTFYFVTEGIEDALARAREAAGDLDVRISGGASVVRQYLNAGLIDQIQLQIVPILLGDGIRLFDGLDATSIR
ncbi:MAG TPA: dihydrofolate reductase family protein, partial [Thermomicrobiales bacterium]|nr:dihydrofolate reductase family protein [Thermomicrobiales bacterium]